MSAPKISTLFVCDIRTSTSFNNGSFTERGESERVVVRKFPITDTQYRNKSRYLSLVESESLSYHFTVVFQKRLLIKSEQGCGEGIL